LEDILARAKKVADEAEVFLVSSKETPVGFEANRLKMLETRETTSLSLRIVRDGRIGFASTTRLDDPQALVDMAVETAQFGAEARFILPAAQRYPQIEVYDPEVEGIATEDMVEIGDSLIARVRSHTPELVCEAGVTKSVGRVNILNSRGGEASYRKSFFTISIEGTLIRDTDMLFVGEVDSSCHPIGEFKAIADSVIKQLELAKRPASVSSGRLPVVLTPKGVRSAFFTPLTLAFNGRMVVEGASPLVGRQGERLFDDRLSLWDDATIDYRPASRPFDDEGVPSQRAPLIEKGVVANFLYDLQTAALAGSRSTGSGNRARGGMPTPSVSALVIEEGDATFEDMIRDMKEGLVVEVLIGAEQGNVLGGEFSGNILLGYKVENGESVGRVKDTMVSGNVYDILKELVAIGGEAKWVGGTLKTPALYLPGLAVASKGW
jgi:PmbA protein